MVNVGWLMPLIVLIVAIFAYWFIIVRPDTKDFHKQVEKAKKHREDIRDIFAEIGKCFARQGFVFEYKIKNDGEYSGRTFPTASGGYINIGYFFGWGEYIIEIRQKNFGDTTTPNEQKAIGIIHREIVEALIYNQRSPNSRYFLKQNLLALKETGVEQFVAGLVGLQREYDKIWSKLEVRRVPESFTTFFNLYDEDYTRFMNAIDLVVDENSPKVEVVKIEAPS
ncbi:MAG: hypothetical protein Q8P69_01705 [bacterium]|nr:hypothetical protein [bacterium]